MQYKTYTGIVIQHRPLREADEVVTVWSWEEGKVRLLARSLKRSTSRLKRVLMPLSWLEFKVVPSEFLPVIISARAVKNSTFLANSLEHLALVFNLFEMILRATPDREPNEKISLLLRESWENLNDRKADDTLAFLINFKRSLISALGYQIQFDSCVVCRNSLTQHKISYFSNISFGFVCESCREKIVDAMAMDFKTRSQLSQLEQAGMAFPKISIPNSAKVKIDRFLSDLFYLLTERQLKSSRFLQENIAN